MKHQKKICVVTGSRADYGLLRPLLTELKRDSDFKLQLVVTGMHLSREFGATERFIASDRFVVAEKIDIGLKSDTPVGIANSMGIAIQKMAKAYRKLNPELIVLLGDRFEILSAAVAATVLRIPIAHLHGGELTEGSFDDCFRHAITKMSHLHFTATKECRRRVIQLGEMPQKVFCVGAIGLEGIRNSKLLTKNQTEKKLGFRFDRRNLLVTFHPATAESVAVRDQFRGLLAALEELKETRLIFTKSNADTGGREINRMIDHYVKKNKKQAVAFSSLGQTRYWSVMKYVDAVVGNSSSGIIEAPSFKIGTINVGDRQKGRIQATSVISCQSFKEDIRKVLKTLYSGYFQKRIKTTANPYGDGKTTKRILAVLKRINFNTLIPKKFFNITQPVNHA